MHEVAYCRATTVESAIEAMRAQPAALFIAGGTTVVDLLRERVWAPDVLIDISALPLREIRVESDAIHIGALVPNSDLAWNPAIQSLFPVLSQALLAGASGQIRNMATVGGNLLQRTRCPYYRELNMPCNKRSPGSGCAALDGYNRSHAVLGGSSHCVATHPSDFTVALTALEAVVALRGPLGEREMTISEFYRLPDSTPEKETNLGRDELIVGIKLPHVPSARRSHYLKVRDRQSFEFALASVAAVVEVDGGVLRQARLALGGVGTVPWRAREAEQLLSGKRPSPQLFADAADLALAGARALRHNAFKVPLARRTIIATLEEVCRT